MSTKVINCKATATVHWFKDFGRIGLEILIKKGNSVCNSKIIEASEENLKELMFIFDVERLSDISDKLCRCHYDEEEKLIGIENIYEENRGIFDKPSI